MTENQLFFRVKYFLLFVFLSFSSLHAGEGLFLRDNLKKARPGDYVVTSQNKAHTLLLIFDKKGEMMTLEEITVPINAVPRRQFNWKEWVTRRAPGHTSWVRYTVDLSTGQMNEYFSFTQNRFYQIMKEDNFLSNLLNLHFHKIPLHERKKVGPPPTDGPDFRKVWHPKMIVEGQEIKGVLFDAWRTHWPKDQSELSGKTIEVYLPQENEKYPSYFPYWLQISGMVGKARVRIIDSGSHLQSPMKKLLTSHPQFPSA